MPFCDMMGASDQAHNRSAACCKKRLERYGNGVLTGGRSKEGKSESLPKSVTPSKEIPCSSGKRDIQEKGELKRDKVKLT